MNGQFWICQNKFTKFLPKGIPLRIQLDLVPVRPIIIASMPLPSEPVTLNVEQITELEKKLSNLRHDVNNNLSLIMSAVEILRRRPEAAERMLNSLSEQPHKIAKTVAEFSRELEAALQIRRP